jgi:hypothetical protein
VAAAGQALLLLRRPARDQGTRGDQEDPDADLMPERTAPSVASSARDALRFWLAGLSISTPPVRPCGEGGITATTFGRLDCSKKESAPLSDRRSLVRP